MGSFDALKVVFTLLHETIQSVEQTPQLCDFYA